VYTVFRELRWDEQTNVIRTVCRGMAAKPALGTAYDELTAAHSHVGWLRKEMMLVACVVVDLDIVEMVC
jgi:hypothetical protein